MINRSIQSLVTDALNRNFVCVVYGPRQVGKTTLVQTILADHPQYKGIYLDCDDVAVRNKLKNQSTASLTSYFTNVDLIVIDEAQKVENIGTTAKQIHDQLPDIKLILTGSSSLELANKINEPLTGRSKDFLLHPLSLAEIASNVFQADGVIKRHMTYGGYPKIWTSSDDEAEERARLIARSFLYKDSFALGTIFDQTVMDNLLILLAQRIGSEIRYDELAQSLEVSRQTVMRYIGLLEKAFIVFRLQQYRKNMRVKVGRLRKIYFYDLGMRNAILGDFKPFETRIDNGALWENYVILERLKKQQRDEAIVSSYYWRSRDRQEVDLIEDSPGNVFGYEIKWSKTPKPPAGFSRNYPNANFIGITKENYWTYLV